MESSREVDLLDRERHLLTGQKFAATQAQQLTAEQKQQDIFEAHRHRVFSVGYYMTANEAEAESILTATFVGAFTGAPEPDAESVDRALLQQLEARFSLAPTSPATPESGAGLGCQIRKTDMEEAVGQLPPRERLAFLLCDVQGYKPGKIGQLLGSEELEIQKVLLSARIRMRNALHQLRLRELGRSAAELPEIAECA